MKTFLHEVAEDLYARYGEGLSERAILFPSRRARLFFVDALTGIAGRPMWQCPRKSNTWRISLIRIIWMR
mgnify:CR=1 FL=1